MIVSNTSPLASAKGPGNMVSSGVLHVYAPSSFVIVIVLDCRLWFKATTSAQRPMQVGLLLVHRMPLVCGVALVRIFCSSVIIAYRFRCADEVISIPYLSCHRTWSGSLPHRELGGVRFNSCLFGQGVEERGRRGWGQRRDGWVTTSLRLYHMSCVNIAPFPPLLSQSIAPFPLDHVLAINNDFTSR